MTSITDVFNELVKANTTLGQLHADAQAETQATNQVKNSVDDVKASIDALAQIETATAKLVFHLTQQADAMICALEHISKNTCGILTQETIQTRLQTEMAADLDAVRFVEDSAHPGAVLERERLGGLRTQIERCCPPEVPEPACTYRPCPHPDPVKEPGLPKPPRTPKQPG